MDRFTTAGRRAAVAWILLDWAASAFSAILITLVVAYVERVVFADSAWGVAGGVVVEIVGFFGSHPVAARSSGY